MRRAWCLTPRAEEALVEIARWTIRTFGVAQADAYETTLIAASDAIADGTAQVRDCSPLVLNEAAGTLLIIRAGRHFVIFTKIGEEVVIVDFIHGRADLPRHLTALRGRGV